jgi:hypothetical protein
MARTSGPMSEAQWQAESDCDALMRAAKIKKDPKRLKAAAAVAKQRLEEAAAAVSTTSDKE